MADGVPDSGTGSRGRHRLGTRRRACARFPHASAMHAASGNGRIGAGQVDVLEQAPARLGLGEALGAQPPASIVDCSPAPPRG